MQLVALICHDKDIESAFSHDKTVEKGFYLQPMSLQYKLEDICLSLRHLHFAGAIVLKDNVAHDAFSVATRSSLEARELGAADTLSVTASGLIADFSFGRALGKSLQAQAWNIRGARAVVLGSGVRARAICRELASLGVQHLTLLSQDQVKAQQMLKGLAVSTQIVSLAPHLPLALELYAQADLVIHCADNEISTLPAEALGPHLSIVDLSPVRGLSPLRQQALRLGANTIGLRDVQAQQLSMALSQILGLQLEPRFFLENLHSSPHHQNS